MSPKRERRIRARLARHAELMAHWEAEGWSHEGASKLAYDQLLAEADGDPPPDRDVVADMLRD